MYAAARTWVALGAGLALGAIGSTSCRRGGGGGGLRELEGGLELALKRGGAWSTLTVRPPYVIGPRVNLQIKKGLVTGNIDGQGLNLKMERDSFHGTGPMGAVAVEIDDLPELMEIDGTWNGARVHFSATALSLKGSIAIAQGRKFDQVFFCQYVLDRVEQDGARAGTSICNGMPEDTLVEIPRTVQNWLTRSEMVVVMLALLSSPPFTPQEGGPL